MFHRTAVMLTSATAIALLSSSGAYAQQRIFLTDADLQTEKPLPAAGLQIESITAGLPVSLSPGSGVAIEPGINYARWLPANELIDHDSVATASIFIDPIHNSAGAMLSWTDATWDASISIAHPVDDLEHLVADRNALSLVFGEFGRQWELDHSGLVKWDFRAGVMLSISLRDQISGGLFIGPIATTDYGKFGIGTGVMAGGLFGLPLPQIGLVLIFQPDVVALARDGWEAVIGPGELTEAQLDDEAEAAATEAEINSGHGSLIRAQGRPGYRNGYMIGRHSGFIS